ncbi:MAG TPA: porin [Planctomycetota bacterium]|nr:porin [Planctomycetota bacterium]
MKAPHTTVSALGLLALSAPTLQAQQTTEASATQQRLEAQELRIQTLEASLAETKRREESVPDAPTGLVAGYDKGFYIRSADPSNPFALRINGRMQFRYTGVAPDSETYDNLGTAASGSPIDLKARNDFEIERGRLEFRGTGFDPNLHFYINIDADTDDAHRAVFHDFWFNYEFNDAFDLHAGKAFVPGSREWLGGSTSTHLIDRSMATTFFRPDRSLGVWASGEPLEDLHYRAMVGNGFQTTDLDFDEINDDLMFSGSAWWEPSGDFGGGYADLKAEEHLRTRFGTSLTYARENGINGDGDPVAESSFLRLDDGTRLTSLGVDHFDLTLLAVDAALKHSGFSLHGEGYYRWVGDIGPTAAAPGGFPDDSNESYGGYVGVGYMLVPETFDVQVRYSTVQGDFHDSYEYAAGVNYYLDGTHANKLSLDVTDLDGSPTSNSAPGFTIGQDGLMVRLQWQASF